MDSFLEIYITLAIFDHIESVGGTFYPTKEFFINEIKKQISSYIHSRHRTKSLAKSWNYPEYEKSIDIKILFTCFSDKEFMNIAFIGPLSNSKYDILIPRNMIDREYKLNYLLKSKKSTSN